MKSQGGVSVLSAKLASRNSGCDRTLARIVHTLSSLVDPGSRGVGHRLQFVPRPRFCTAIPFFQMSGSERAT